MPAASRDQQVPRLQEVFISYSRKDKEFVRRLDEALKRRDREAWVDWEGIPPGDTWEKTIYGAIEATHTFIFVLTPDSVASEVCGKEVAHAAANNKRLVPIVHRDVAADRVPKSLGELNWIFCRESDDFEEATNTLIRALDTDLKWVRAHTRLLTRAIEWDANGRNNSFVLRGEDLRSAEQWLAEAGAQKERQPTPLQTEYIIASRKAAARRQRITLGAVAVGGVIALVLAALAWTQRNRAIERGEIARRTSAQADFDVAALYQRNADLAEPKALAHLARSLRTRPEAAAPRYSLVSLLRDRVWHLPATEPLRHADAVEAAAFSGDGTVVVTASADKTARLWDAKTGRPIGEPMAHEAPVLAAVFSADGKRLLTRAEDGTARVWDAHTGKAICEPMHRDHNVFSAALNASGTRVLTRAPGVSRLWDAATGRIINTSDRGAWAFQGSAKFSPDGEFILGTKEGWAGIFDAKTGQPLGEPLAHSGVSAIEFSPNGRWLVIVAGEKAQLLDAKTRQPQGQAMEQPDGVWRVQFNRNGTRLLTSSAMGTARLWDTQTCRAVGELMRYSGTLNGADLNVSGTRLVTQHLGGDVHLWDTKTGRPVGGTLYHDVDQTPPAFSPDGKMFVTFSRALKTARLWDARTGKPLGEPLRHADQVIVAAFSADGKRVLTASKDHTAAIWDVVLPRPVYLLVDRKQKEMEAVHPVEFSSDSTRLLRKDGNGARMWDVATGQPFGKPLAHQGDLAGACFSPGGARIATASADWTARIWDAKTCEPVGAPLQHQAAVESVLFSPDGKCLVTAAEDKTVRVWDTETGQQIGSPLPHPATVYSVRFSSDGTRILTISDQTVRVWDIQTGKVIGKPIRCESPLAFFNKDQTRILTVGPQQAELWDAAAGTRIGVPLRPLAMDAGFSADGTRVIAASAEHKALIWDSANGQPVPELPRATSEAEGFSADGMRIVTTALGREQARIWDAVTGQPLSEPFPYPKQITSAIFDPSGKRVATISSDDLVEIWDVATDLDGPLPDWVGSLAEALAGERLDENGRGVTPEKSIFVLRQEIEAAAVKANDFWSRFGRWFFMRGPERKISPDAQITVGELPPVRSPPPPTPEPEAVGSKGRSNKDTYKEAVQPKKITASAALE